MREFFVIKKNGTGMVVDAMDEEDALSQAGPDVVSIEESAESISRNQSNHFILQEVDEYIVENKTEPKSQLEQQVEKLIIAINQTKNVSVWERRFAYGLKRHLKDNNKFTDLQMEKFQRLYVKLVR